MAFKRNINQEDTLGWSAAHDYHSWPLSCSPTYFNTDTEKYVYAAIPRTSNTGTQAVVVFPSELLDIYGKNADEEQIGSDEYLYIYLQGKISATDGTADRTWIVEVETGTLDTPEGEEEKKNRTEWFEYSIVTETVSFLKKIIMSGTSWFQNLRLGSAGDNLTGVATAATSDKYINSEELVATPSYIHTNYLSRKTEDTAQEQIGFLKGLWVKAQGLFGIDRNGNAKTNDIEIAGSASIGGNLGVKGIASALKGIFSSLMSANYSGDSIADTGYRLTSDDGGGASKLTVDKLYVRMKAVFEELQVKRETVTGGNQVFSCAANVINRTDYYKREDGVDTLIGYTTLKLPWTLRGVPTFLQKHTNKVTDIFATKRLIRIRLDDTSSISFIRCYFLAKVGDEDVSNLWQVNDLARCQTFNLNHKERETYISGTSTQSGNVFWWRRIIAVSSTPVEIDGRLYHYFDVSMTDCAADSDLPAAGDHVSQWGNTTNTKRMNLRTIEVDGTNGAVDKWYRGIYTFDMSKCWWGGNPCKDMISAAAGAEFNGAAFKFVQEYGVERAVVDRGAWAGISIERNDYSPHGDVRKCYNNDRVSHDGSLWLCTLTDGYHWVINNGTDENPQWDYIQNPTAAQIPNCKRVRNYSTQTPSDTAADWLKQVAVGESTLIIDIDNSNDQFGTDSNGKVVSAQSKTTNVTMLYGTQQQAFLSAPTIALKYEDGTSVPAAVAAATIAVVSGTSNKQYLVTVSVKATGTGSTVFGTSGHSGLYVDISGTCSYGTKSIRFTLEKLMSGAQGVSPTIYQLDLSQKVLTYSRDASNNLVAQSNSVTVGVKRTVGNTTDHLTLAASGLTCTWGYDGTYTTNALSTSNPTITVAAGSVGSHTKVSIQLSTGDKENVTIVKDGTNGDDADYIYLRGTGDSDPADRLVYISNQTNQSSRPSSGRGIEIVTVLRSTLSKVASQLFDTYGGTMSGHADQDAACNAAAAYLNGLDDTVFVCITSWDAIGWNDTLIGALKNFGLGALAYTATGRYPFAFLGYRGLQEGYALWQIHDTGASEPYAEVSAYIANGVFMSSKDGNGIQSVTRTYAISTQVTTASDTTAPAISGSWSASSPAVTEAYPYLWAREVVTYTNGTSTTKYYCIGARGQNGVDAQDIEWVYIRTKTDVPPVIYSDSSYTDSNSKTYTADDHLPRVSGSGRTDIETNGGSSSYPQCTDDPKGVDSTWQYEWEIKREKGAANANGHRSWTAYSGTMTLHNNYAASLLEIDIDNDNDQFGTDSDGKVIDAQSRTTNVTMYYGAGQQAFTATPTIALKYDDGTSVPDAVAAATIAVVSGTSNKQYRVTVSVKATGTGSTVFGTSGHSGLYVDISGTCTYGTKSIRFTLEKLMSGAAGVSPTIYQLNPTRKSFSFSRDASNNLTPSSQASQINVARTVGNATTVLSTAQTGITYSWGYDDSTTTQESGKAVGSSITISNTNAASHTSIWVLLSTGDRETLSITKDGTNGTNGADAPDVNPNMLLRTVFDKGMDFIKEKWITDYWNAVALDTSSGAEYIQGRRTIRINAANAGAPLGFTQSMLGKIKPDTWYTMSFYSFSSKAFNFFIYNYVNAARTNIYADNKVILDGVEVVIADNGNNDVRLPSAWDGARHTITFKTRASSHISTEILRCGFYLNYDSSSTSQSAQVLVLGMLKLEEGQNATAYMANDDDLVGETGSKGDDAVNVIVSPASLIINQDLNNPSNLSSLTEMFSIQVKRGDTSLAVNSIQFTAEKTNNNYKVFFLKNGGSTGGAGTVTGSTLILKAINTYQQNYYDRAYADLIITYDTNKTVTTRVSIYANLLGTWSETVKAGVKAEIAESNLFDIDPDTGKIVESNNLATYIRSSQENTATISKMNGEGQNLLLGTDAFTSTNKLVHESAAENGWVEYRPTNSSTRIYTAIDLVAGKEYVLQCMTDGTLASAHVFDGTQTGKCTVWLRYFGDETHNLLFTSTNLSGTTASGAKWWRFAPIITGTYYFRTNTYSDGSTEVTAQFWDIMLELGSTPSTWGAPKRNSISSQFSQKADGIALIAIQNGLETAGVHLDGNGSVINLKAGKVNFVDPNGYAYATPKISINPVTGTLTAVDGTFQGTVRAQNLFRAVVRIGEQNWYYCSPGFEEYYLDSEWVYNFQSTKYYTLDEMVELSDGVLGGGEPYGFILCTGPADIIIIDPGHYNDTASVTVILPRAIDFDGKMIEIMDTRYTQPGSNYAIGALYLRQVEGSNNMMQSFGAIPYSQLTLNGNNDHDGMSYRFISNNGNWVGISSSSNLEARLRAIETRLGI